MDLEHHDLGEHCSMPGCNQRDFLAFTCDVCSRKLCLQHRSYLNHECTGEGSKNITSIACPICNKTIKYNQTENIDIVWENHYLNECTQKAAKPAATKTCPACNTKLGLTNVFHCKICNKDLCLSHRSPEDHECEKVNSKRKNYYENKFQTERENKFQKETKKESGPSISKPSSSSQSPSISKASSSSSSSNNTINRKVQYSCPICNQGFQSTETLNRHVDSVHLENSTPPINTANSTGREVCPVCNQKFADPIALVDHFELKHNNNNNNDNNNRQPAQSEPTCCIQ